MTTAAPVREPRAKGPGISPGIRLRIDPSWIGIAAILFPTLWMYFGNGIAAAVAELLFFASIVAHEYAHGLVARARGIPVERVTLFLFGGVSEMREEPRRPADEALIAGAGPLCSAALGGGFLLLETRLGGLPADAAGWLGRVNLALALFNLLPGYPLDGGRILRAAFWAWSGDYARSTRRAASAGVTVAWLLISAGIALVALGAVFDGIWLALVGGFLLSAARGAR